MTDLLNLFDDLERNTTEDYEETDGVILLAPFEWPGCKTRSVKFIVPPLPYYNTDYDAFGSHGPVLIVRKFFSFES